MNTANQIFSINRFLLTAKKNCIDKSKPILFAALAYAAFISLITHISLTLSREVQSSPSYYDSYFKAFFIIGGILTACTAMSHFHKKNQLTAAMMLPASVFEKYLSLLLLSTAGFFLFTAVSICAVSLFIHFTGKLFHGITPGIFIPWRREVFNTIPLFLVLQSLFFLGGATFKKNAFLKTSVFLTLSLFAVFIILISSIARESLLHFVEQNSAYQSFTYTDNLGEIPAEIKELTSAYFTGMKIAIPFICYLVSFFKLKEIEFHQAK